MIAPKRLPFSNTKVDPERTKGQIINLLKSYGVTDYIWAEQGDMVQLGFKAEIEYEGKPKSWNVMLRPPLRFEQKRVWDEGKRATIVKNIPNYSQSYRFMLHYLKIKLMAVFSGAYKFEEEFMADLMVPTREGPKRFADMVKTYKPGLLLEGPDEISISEKKQE